MAEIKVGNLTHACTADCIPDECPICRRHITPVFKFSHLIGIDGSGDASVNIVYACPSDDCQRLFIAYFKENWGRETETYSFRSCLPKSQKDPVVFKGIKEISPSFVAVYTQSLHAEAIGLDQIAGVGLRKALEFLVKDYCSAERPENADAIKAVQLGTCIENYIADQNIKDCAKLASWLGNDETHYVRKWVDRDVTDLKALLGLTMSWIETSLKTKAYKASMMARTG
jgi:hypothetical protein